MDANLINLKRFLVKTSSLYNIKWGVNELRKDLFILKGEKVPVIDSKSLKS